MPDSTSQPPSPHNAPWENGWTPDSSRTPGTRRLWLAGTLAATTIVSCVAAIALTDKHSDEESHTKQAAPSAPADTDGPGLLSFASPSKSTPTPDEHTPTSAKAPTTSAAAAKPGSLPSTKAPVPSKSTSSHSSSSGSSSSSATWKSVRSVNYPDRYWQVSGDYVKLNPISSASARRAATFKLVKGLAKSSCYSFATADGTYLRHRSFVLRAERNDGSSLFKQDATFCPRTSSYSGAVMLESVNYPGRFLRHQNFQLKLDRYQNGSLYGADSAFRLVDGLS
nr:AbfB domain-containing protein [Streptomyces sp. NBC_00886]